MTKKRLNITVALAAEAHALVRVFSLKGVVDSPYFRLYENDHVRLIVTGVGEINAAAAVALINGLFNDNSAWLNIGLAGGAHHPLQSVHYCNKVSDAETQRTHFINKPATVDASQMELVTVSKPETLYPREDVLYDMEGYGFLTTAIKFVPFELCGLVKVVSDNRKNAIDLSRIRETCDVMMERSIPTVISLAEYLMGEAQSYQKRYRQLDEWVSQEVLETFSFTERVELQRWVQKAQSVMTDEDLRVYIKKNPKDLLEHLRTEIQQRAERQVAHV